VVGGPKGTGVRPSNAARAISRFSRRNRRRARPKLKAEQWDVVIDDDGTGEIADIVAMRIEAGGLVMKFVHCKYSKEITPGARVADLYEVCGQTQKSIIWRRNDLRLFFKALEDRARRKQEREGISPFEGRRARGTIERDPTTTTAVTCSPTGAFKIDRTVGPPGQGRTPCGRW
jgi:hypothetical protein